MTTQKITTGGNWSVEDQLGGRTIRDGERLRVRFPDGTVEELRAVVESSSHADSDMGRDITIPVHRAFARIDYHGASVLMSLVGLEAERPQRSARRATSRRSR